MTYWAFGYDKQFTLFELPQEKNHPQRSHDMITIIKEI
jgi:hypothetical protein